MELRRKHAKAVRSKLKLLQNSSLEIERMRDDIRLLSGHRPRSCRDLEPGSTRWSCSSCPTPFSSSNSPRSTHARML